MSNVNDIEIALRAAKVAKTILGVLDTRSLDVKRMIWKQASNEMIELATAMDDKPHTPPATR